MDSQQDDGGTGFRYHRRSIRLPKFDYTWTRAYFVTIRVKTHDPLFEIPQLRQILVETWEGLPQQFTGVTLDEFVIMPDHIHFILWLDGTRKDVPLGNIVGAYKSITTVQWIQHLKSVGKDMHYPCRIWREKLIDRFVRIDELEQTRLYIRNNPKKLYPGNNPDVG